MDPAWLDSPAYVPPNSVILAFARSQRNPAKLMASKETRKAGTNGFAFFLHSLLPDSFSISNIEQGMSKGKEANPARYELGFPSTFEIPCSIFIIGLASHSCFLSFVFS